MFDERRLAIVSENMARESWREPREAIGKRIRIGRDGPLTEVIGVVEDIHADGLHQPAPPTVYARAGVEAGPNGSTTVRRAVTMAIRSSRAGSQAFLKEVAAAVHAVNASVPLADVRTLDDAYRRSLARTSFTVTLIGVAAVMALALAVVGVYGVLAYAVASRRRKWGSASHSARNLGRCAPSFFDKACYSRRSGAFWDSSPRRLFRAGSLRCSMALRL